MSQSKALIAAIILQNEKVEAYNNFYLYHKEVIDEFFRMQQEVSEAKSQTAIVKINQCRKVPVKRPDELI